MDAHEEPDGLRNFIIVVSGQLVSIIGTGLTNFAIGVWVYERTGSVTKFSLMILAATLPSILVSPVAGALVDRWDRRRTMMLGDTVSGLCSLALFTLLYFERLEVWHVALAVAASSVASVFHGIAYTATVPLVIPQRHLARAVGVMQIGPAVAQVLSPMLAGVLLGLMPIHQVIMVDFATFLFALSTLALARLPSPPRGDEGEGAGGSLWREARAGWDYIRARSGLLWLLYFFTVYNFTMAMSNVVLTPMLLDLVPIQVVGTIASVASLGMLAGSLLLSVWGGPKRRIRGVLGFGLLLGVSLVLMGLRPSPILIALAGFGFVFAVPLIDGCNQTIWLTKTPPHMQGRVISTRMMVGWAAAPLAYVVAGPLGDRVFEPLLAAGGSLSSTVGAVVGTGPGRGLGLLLITLGVFTLLATLVICLNPRVLNVEDELPDALPAEPGEVESAEAVMHDKQAASSV